MDWTPSIDGARTIDARYLGNDAVRPSEAAGLSVNVAAAEVGKTGSTTTLDPVAMTTLGQSITLRAVVDPADAGGQLTFFDGAVALETVSVGADGVATYVWTPTTDGERSVWADYGGAGNVLGSQASIQVVVSSAVDVPNDDDDSGSGAPGTGSLGSVTGSLGALGG